MAHIKRRDTGYVAEIDRRFRGERIRIARTFDTEDGAYIWAKAIEGKLKAGTYNPDFDSETATLADCIRKYIHEVTPSKAGAKQEKRRLETWLLSNLSRKRPSDVSVDDVRRHIDNRRVELANKRVNADAKRVQLGRPPLTRGNGENTIRLELAPLSNLYREYLKRWGFGQIENPFFRPKGSNGALAPSTERNRRLVGDEEIRLLSAATPLDRIRNEKGRFQGIRNVWIKPVIQFAIWTAARKSEILFLEWCDITIYADGSGSARLRETKDTKSRGKSTRERHVPLLPPVVSMLKSLRSWKSKKGRVFDTTETAIDESFEHVLLIAKIENLTFHDLRHEGTSRWANLVHDVHELAKITGHRDLRMLARYFNPTAEEMATKVVKRYLELNNE